MPTGKTDRHLDHIERRRYVNSTLLLKLAKSALGSKKLPSDPHTRGKNCVITLLTPLSSEILLHSDRSSPSEKFRKTERTGKTGSSSPCFSEHDRDERLSFP